MNPQGQGFRKDGPGIATGLKRGLGTIMLRNSQDNNDYGFFLKKLWIKKKPYEYKRNH